MLTADLAVIFFKYFISHRPPRCRQRAFYMAHVSVGYVDIHLGGLDVVVPHKFLHYLQVGALLDKVRGKGVAQQVGINQLGYAGFTRRRLQPLRHDALGELLAWLALKEPRLRLVQPTVFRQFLYHRSGKQREAVFASFSLPDTDQRARHVDVVGTQRQKLAYSKHRRIEDGKHAEKAQINRHGIQARLDLFLAQHVGQHLLALCPAHLVTMAFAPQHFLVIELDALMRWFCWQSENMSY